jgi:ADP-ribosyl-[dinitrogen reductase] hydrolase
MLCGSLGGDVDTICCIYGQIAGSFYGYSEIPEKWLTGLQNFDMVANIVIELMEKSTMGEVFSEL